MLLRLKLKALTVFFLLWEEDGLFHFNRGVDDIEMMCGACDSCI